MWSAPSTATAATDAASATASVELLELDDCPAELTGYGLGGAFVRGMVEMSRAKDEGLDDAVSRTPETTSPTTLML